MRVSVVVNSDGDIVAIGPPDGETLDREEGGPTHHAFIPGEGQWVVTTDLPDELATADRAALLHQTHRVAGRGSDAAFIEREGEVEH